MHKIKSPAYSVIFATVVVAILSCFVFPVESMAADEAPELLPPLKAELDKSEAKVDGETSGKKIKNIDPDKKLAVEYLRHGAKLHKSGHVLIAETFFMKAIKLDPQNPDGYFNLGALYETKGDNNEALMHYRLGLSRAPDDTELVEAVRYLEAKIAEGDVKQNDVSDKGPFSLKSSLNTTGLNKSNNGGVAPMLTVGQLPQAKPVVSSQNKFSSGKTRVILGTLLRIGLRVGLRAAIGGGGCIGF